MTTDYRSLYDKGEYIGSWELPEGKDVVVTIENVKGGELIAPGNKKSKKPIVSFVGKEKKLVVNKVNGKAIAGMYGPKVEGWIGKQIALYVGSTRDPSTGDQVPCIRVRPKIPSGSTPTAKVEHPSPSGGGSPTAAANSSADGRGGAGGQGGIV